MRHSAHLAMAPGRSMRTDPKFVYTCIHNLMCVILQGGPGSPVGTFNDVGIAAHRHPRMEGLVKLSVSLFILHTLLGFECLGQGVKE